MKAHLRDGISYSKKTKAVCDLINAGNDPADSYELINPEKEPLTRANKSLLVQKAKNLMLVDNKRHSKAIKALDQILAGKLVGDAKSINTSDILSAIKMIADRAEPVVSQNVNINAKVKISPVDLSNYLNKEE